MILSDSGLIFFFPFSFFCNHTVCHCEGDQLPPPPPLQRSVLKAAVDVWRLATGGGKMQNAELEGKH